ncbi:RDD family protein [Saxibacter everestensis]|uniref:RDD family protein n=1 Tax=Saxibacter everestensis TaxID=2909229 RepID=A0ABY8QYN8_9MICO|nr:RDD family protein [Brevibacteriaceae bacterium ZFBP1038]
MVDRRDIGTWIEGTPTPGEPVRWPGERLGRPENGSGSMARFGRRLIALIIDWGLAFLIAKFAFDSNQWAILGIFAAEQILLVGTLGYSIGHRILGLRVIRLDGRWPGPLWAFVRTVLLCLVIPAGIWDADQRGLHDKAAGTALVRI